MGKLLLFNEKTDSLSFVSEDILMIIFNYMSTKEIFKFLLVSKFFLDYIKKLFSKYNFTLDLSFTRIDSNGLKYLKESKKLI